MRDIISILVILLVGATSGCDDGQNTVDDADVADVADADADVALDAADDAATDAAGDADDAEVEADASADADVEADADDGEPAEPCTDFAEAEETGEVDSDELREISGIAVSRVHDDVIYAHNDSGDSARFFALRFDGSHLAEFTLQFSSARDWEDMAIGPGPSGGDWLYFGDIGDNAEVRGYVLVFAVAEPDDPTVDDDLGGVERYFLEYPDGAHNAETLMVDPRTGDLYILTKASDGVSGLYVLHAPLESDAELELAATIEFPDPDNESARLTTAGDISPRGDAILVRTYESVSLWTRGPEQSLSEAMLAERIELPYAEERQGESIAYTADGRGYFTISEGNNPSIYFFAAIDCQE